MGETLRIILQGLFFLYTQILLVPALSVWNTMPSLLLPWVIYTIWKKPFTKGISVVFAIGLMYDVLSPETFGLHALIYVVIGLLIDVLRQPFEADSFVAIVIAIVVANLTNTLLFVLALGLINGFDGALMRAGVIGLVYNLVFSFVVFQILQYISKLKIVKKYD